VSCSKTYDIKTQLLNKFKLRHILAQLPLNFVAIKQYYYKIKVMKKIYFYLCFIALASGLIGCRSKINSNNGNKRTMKFVLFFLLFISVTMSSCSLFGKKSDYDHFDPVAYIDTNKIANSYIKSYIIASYADDEFRKMYTNVTDESESYTVTGELILNSELYREGITCSYSKDSLNNILSRGVDSYINENKNSANLLTFNANMDLVKTSIGMGLYKDNIISKTVNFLDESASQLSSLTLNATEIVKKPQCIIYKINVLNSNFEKYSRNVKFNFDASGKTTTIQIL